jgi:molybdenum cofactor sulfurtransferase
VTVNFYDKDNMLIYHRLIEQKANEANISLRTGCFCNPGAGEVAMGVSRVELDVCFTSPGNEERLSQDDFRMCFDGKSMGAVRISVGMVTNFNDIQNVLSFASGFLS